MKNEKNITEKILFDKKVYKILKKIEISEKLFQKCKTNTTIDEKIIK